MIDVIVVIVSSLVIGGAVAYIVKSKKSGRKCIGCPYGSACSSSGSSNACHCGEEGN